MAGMLAALPAALKVGGSLLASTAPAAATAGTAGLIEAAAAAPATGALGTSGLISAAAAAPAAGAAIPMSALATSAPSMLGNASWLKDLKKGLEIGGLVKSLLPSTPQVRPFQASGATNSGAGEPITTPYIRPQTTNYTPTALRLSEMLRRGV
jgi:hypothetical protein